MSHDRVAIITAAGRGMGAACARALQARGYRLALMSSGGGAATLAEELGAVAHTGSVTEPDDLAGLVALAMDRYGRIDALVNNTGHPPKGPLLDLTDDQWRAGMDLCLLNVIRMARLVTPHMLERGGAIVNISTFAAFEPSPVFPVSSTMRAALAAYTKLYADEYAARGIRMNNVLPGFIDSYDVDEQTRRRIPMARAGTVEEIGATIAFLLSDEAGYITGQNLRADGGVARSV